LVILSLPGAALHLFLFIIYSGVIRPKLRHPRFVVPLPESLGNIFSQACNSEGFWLIMAAALPLPKELIMPECSRCGEELDAGSLFCGNCGLQIEAPGPAPVQSLPPSTPGKDEITPPPAGVPERSLARKSDWAPALILIGFIGAIVASGIYFWKLSPPSAPQKPVSSPTEPSRKPAPPMTAQGYLKKAIETKDPQEKIRFYSKAIEADPNNAIAYNDRGIVYYRLDNYRLALKDYNKAIAIKPDFAIAYNNRGSVYFNKKDYEKALKDFNKTIELKHDYAYAYNNRGMLYYKKLDNDQAIIDFNKAIELSPDYAYAYYHRGNVYFTQTNYTDAIKDYTKAITLKPDFSIAYCKRGYAYFLKEDYDKALIDYNKALALNPDYANALYRRAILSKKTGAYGQARADYSKAKSLNPRLLDASFPLPAEQDR
jgi:tetratricopeptide (TPR) repeat protein